MATAHRTGMGSGSIQSPWDESDEKPPARYRRLSMELLLARQRAGGKLPDAEESERADELCQLWWSMTNDEQDEYERSIGIAIARAWRHGRAAQLSPQPLAKPSAKPARPLTFREWLSVEVSSPRWLVWSVLLVNVFLALSAVSNAVKTW